MTGYRIIKKLCKLKSSGIKNMFKELPVLECADNYTKAMNYLILALMSYKATAEVIFDRLVNVTIVCQVFKPMLKSQSYKKLKWSHPAIIRWFMFTEVSTSPLRPSTFLPNIQHIVERKKHQNDMLYSLTIIDQNIPITTTKKEVDNHFCYPGRNRVIKKYKNIKDYSSWKDEDDSELVYTELVKSKCSQKSTICELL